MRTQGACVCVCCTSSSFANPANRASPLRNFKIICTQGGDGRMRRNHHHRAGRGARARREAAPTQTPRSRWRRSRPRPRCGTVRPAAPPTPAAGPPARSPPSPPPHPRVTPGAARHTSLFVQLAEDAAQLLAVNRAAPVLVHLWGQGGEGSRNVTHERGARAGPPRCVPALVPCPPPRSVLSAHPLPVASTH